MNMLYHLGLIGFTISTSILENQIEDIDNTIRPKLYISLWGCVGVIPQERRIEWNKHAKCHGSLGYIGVAVLHSFAQNLSRSFRKT